jgi:cell wall-associated NlpC family hydrolase
VTGQAVTLDRRLHAFRPDLADASLRGRIEAARWVEGQAGQILAEVADLKRQPRPDAPVDTQLLFGETVRVFDDDAEGWSWVRAERDGYVGYVATRVLGRTLWPPTHRVIVNRTFIYPGPDMKLPIQGALPLDARVGVTETRDTFVRLASGGYVVGAHIAPLAQPAPDFVAIAEQLAGTPYLWGGKSPGGIDCSGLVQLAMSVADRSIGRDTDMQERDGSLFAVDPAAELRRGDLVFWKGHVGIMLDAERLLHANGHHMLVKAEPLRAAQDRILASTGLPISSVRRLSDYHFA